MMVVVKVVMIVVEMGAGWWVKWVDGLCGSGGGWRGGGLWMVGCWGWVVGVGGWGWGWVGVGVGGCGWVWVGVGGCGCGWVWVGVGGCGWVWVGVGVGGCGWVWVGVGGCGWVWVGGWVAGWVCQGRSKYLVAKFIQNNLFDCWGLYFYLQQETSHN